MPPGATVCLSQPHFMHQQNFVCLYFHGADAGKQRAARLLAGWRWGTGVVNADICLWKRRAKNASHTWESCWMGGCCSPLPPSRTSSALVHGRQHVGDVYICARTAPGPAGVCAKCAFPSVCAQGLSAAEITHFHGTF